jgi:hypothetical protein
MDINYHCGFPILERWYFILTCWARISWRRLDYLFEPPPKRFCTAPRFLPLPSTSSLTSGVADFPAVIQHLMMRVLTLCLSSWFAGDCPVICWNSFQILFLRLASSIWPLWPLSSSLFGPLMMGRCCSCLVTCSYVSILCDWLFALPLRVACCLLIFPLTWDHSPVSAAIAAPHSPCVTRLSPCAEKSAGHHRGTRALLHISAKVTLRGCLSCGCRMLLLYDATCLHGEDPCFFGGCAGRH